MLNDMSELAYAVRKAYTYPEVLAAINVTRGNYVKGYRHITTSGSVYRITVLFNISNPITVDVDVSDFMVSTLPTNVIEGQTVQRTSVTNIPRAYIWLGIASVLVAIIIAIALTLN